MSPTITSPALMTGVGVLLGTAAYMSPEQTKGREADKRSDIWAFGCVLHEMLTGRRAFEGEDVSDTLANVLKTQPEWNALPEATPTAIRRLLRRSLDKDRTRRLHDIADARLEIDEASADPAGDLAMPSRAVSMKRPSMFARALPWAVTAALGVGLAFALWAPWRTPARAMPTRVEATLGADVSLAGLDIGPAIALSLNGRTLAFVAQASGAAPSQLYVRRLDQLQASALAGTEGAFGPFFSPDGEWIAFFANGKLKKVAASGGRPCSKTSRHRSRQGSRSLPSRRTARSRTYPAAQLELLLIRSSGWTEQERSVHYEDNRRTGAILPSRPMAGDSPSTSSMAGKPTCGCTNGTAIRCRG
jgi:hypothetical protein